MGKSPIRQQVPLEQFGKFLRDKFDPITKKPLPKRWVELIHYLNKKERQERGEEARGKPQISN